MLIDIIFIILIVIAIFKGYTKGFIVALFSLLAIIIGLAAAVKLSVVTALWLKNSVHVAARWLPFIAFALVFIIIVLLVRLAANAIQKTLELALLGWLNRLAGILLYACLYIIILSVVLFYAEKLSVIEPAVFTSSKTYYFIKPWGPKAVNSIGELLPFFKDMFHQLEDFFAGISNKIQQQ